MNISLPDAVQSFVDEQVQSGAYGSASEYLRELVSRDQKQQADAKLEALLLEGLESGAPIAFNEEYKLSVRRELEQRRSNKQS